MFFIIFHLILFSNVFSSHGGNITNTAIANASVKDITNFLLNIINNNKHNDTKRVRELKEKLVHINNYEMNQDKYSELLINKSKETDLNATMFYKALLDKDNFPINKSISLYMTLKSRMNRKDLMTILYKTQVNESARRMGDSWSYRRDSLEDAVDKYLGEVVSDQHRFDDSDTYSKYWDPEIELVELQENRHINARRIFRGERTSIKYYPFMASIHIMKAFWCSGVLYWYDLVITSAACLQLLYNNRFFRENAKALMVRVGSDQSRVGGEMIEALEVFFHPAYKPKSLENNIAVIRLRKWIKFSYHRVPKLISLTSGEGGVAFDAEILLLGWGVSKMSQQMNFAPIYLQRKILPIYPRKFCQEVYGEKFITDSMFCAGTITSGEGACSHDAGGPAILGGLLVGIISFGPKVCGLPDAPTVFTYMGRFRDWIETINETIPRRAGGKKTTLLPKNHVLEYFEQFISYKPSTTRELTMPTIRPDRLGPPQSESEDDVTNTNHLKGGLKTLMKSKISNHNKITPFNRGTTSLPMRTTRDRNNMVIQFQDPKVRDNGVW